MDKREDDQWRAVDGIVNEDVYSGQRPKILWVLREPNGEGFDFLDYLRDVTAYPKWKQSYGLVVKISRIVLEGHVDDPDQWGICCPEVMHRIALINIKKTGGGRAVNRDALKQAFAENKDFLRNQILEIKPDYIFCGGTCGYIKELRITDIPIIDLYHPGQTKVTHEEYIKDAITQYKKHNKTIQADGFAAADL